MAIIHVDSSYLKVALDEFCKLLTELVGPRGCRCLLSSATELLTLTSSSSRIVSNLSVGSPVLQFILQCIKSQTDRYGDGGLYCGTLLSKLLVHLIDGPVPQNVACSILTELGCIAQSELRNSIQLRLRVNLDSVLPLMAVARSILSSKSGLSKCKDAQSHSDAQITLLVQSFLQSEASVEKVLLCVNEKVDKQRLLSGVLYPCSDGENYLLKDKPWNSVSILLFTVMLTNKLDSKEKKMQGVEFSEKGKTQFEDAQIFIHKAILCGINIVACQKVIHPSFILKLKRCGVLVLERLGKRLTEAVSKLSGAVPISCLKTSDLDSLSSLKGQLRRVQNYRDSGKDFILMEGSPESSICSLLLNSRSLESGAELKVAAHQVLSGLSQVLQDGVVCPGGGCTEVYLFCFLQEEVHRRRNVLCEKLRCSFSQLESVVKWFQEGLLLASGLNFKAGNLAVDSIYHHAWKGASSKNSVVDVSTCNCKLISSDAVFKFKGEWSIIVAGSTDILSKCKPIEAQGSTFTSSMTCESVLDVCSTKTSALNLALDSALAIINIGAIITS